MNDNTSNLDQNEEEILTHDVSDEALENAGGSNWTFGACTGLSCDNPN
jgi:hypothetical protein